MSALLNHSKDDDCMWHEGVADVYRCTYEGRCKNGKDCVTGKECERCGGSGMLRKCNQTERFEYGCCGDGTCDVTVPVGQKGQAKRNLVWDIMLGGLLGLASILGAMSVIGILYLFSLLFEVVW